MRQYIPIPALLLAYSLSIPGAAAQLVSIGVKGAVPVNAPYSPSDESRPYIIGPSVEFRLPGNFAVEADALYQRTGYSTLLYPVTIPSSTVTTSYSARQRGNAWQFPILGKYYFRSRRYPWQPYVGTGYAVRTTWTHVTGEYTTVDGGQSTTVNLGGDYRSPLDVGLVVAAGFRMRLGPVKLLPEFRYTRWGAADFQTRKNNVTFLLGLSF